MDAKALQEDMESLGFTPSLAKPEMGKKVRRQRTKRVRVTRREGRDASEIKR